MQGGHLVIQLPDVPLQQENVAQLENDFAQAGSNRLVLASDGEQGAGTPYASPEVGPVTSFEGGTGGHHRLDKAEVLAFEGIDALAYFLSQPKTVLF